VMASEMSRRKKSWAEREAAPLKEGEKKMEEEKEEKVGS